MPVDMGDSSSSNSGSGCTTKRLLIATSSQLMRARWWQIRKLRLICGGGGGANVHSISEGRSVTSRASGWIGCRREKRSHSVVHQLDYITGVGFAATTTSTCVIYDTLLRYTHAPSWYRDSLIETHNHRKIYTRTNDVLQTLLHTIMFVSEIYTQVRSGAGTNF